MADNSWGVHYPELPDAPNIPADFKQAVDDLSHTPPKFGSAGARGSALTGLNAPVEGDLTYLSDVDRYQRYNGSVWVDAVPRITGVRGSQLAGSAFNANTMQLQTCFVHTVETLNVSGEVVVAFPVAFPNCLLGVSVSNGDPGARANTHFSVIVGVNTTLAGVHVKGYTPAGVAGGGPARLLITAHGA